MMPSLTLHHRATIGVTTPRMSAGAGAGSTLHSDGSIQPTTGGLPDPINAPDESGPSTVGSILKVRVFEVWFGDRGFPVWDLPKKSLHQVLGFLLPDDRLAFARTSKATSEALSESPELWSARACLMARKANSFVEVHHVLRRIQKVPKDFRAEPLLALGYRLPWLYGMDPARMDRNVPVPRFFNKVCQQTAFKNLEAAAAGFPEVLCSVKVLLRAVEVRDLIEFDAVLDEIFKVRENLQAQPLLALGYCIHLLPVDDQRAMAADAFVAAARLVRRHFTETEKSALEGLLKAAAQTGPGEPAASLVRHVVKIAADDVCGGESIDAAVMRYCIPRSQLECELMSRACDEMKKRKAAVPTVASKFSIASEANIFALEQIAIEAHAGKEVQAGGNVGHVAAEYGFTMPSSFSRLRALKPGWSQALLRSLIR